MSTLLEMTTQLTIGKIAGSIQCPMCTVERVLATSERPLITYWCDSEHGWKHEPKCKGRP